jgi:hypothetical protein
MSNNFAPYQDVSPDITRSFSPPPRSPPPKSPSPRVQVVHQNITRAISPPTSPSYQNNQDYINFPSNDHVDRASHASSREGGGPFWSSRSGIDLYETSLGIRLDWEACLAYLGLPPAGPALLLMFEHRSDYVRWVETMETLQETLLTAVDSMRGNRCYYSPHFLSFIYCFLGLRSFRGWYLWETCSSLCCWLWGHIGMVSMKPMPVA